MKKRVIAAVDDLFFASKIRGTSQFLNIEVEFAKNMEALIESARRETPALIIVDLQAQCCDPFALAETLKADTQLRAIPLVGFFSHVQIELPQRAAASGFDRVMPRSTFTKQLPEILLGE